jgi:hypothetical protein
MIIPRLGYDIRRAAPPPSSRNPRPLGIAAQPQLAGAARADRVASDAHGDHPRPPMQIQPSANAEPAGPELQ